MADGRDVLEHDDQESGASLDARILAPGDPFFRASLDGVRQRTVK